MDEDAAIALQSRMAEICGHLNVLHAQLVQTVVEALEGDLWMQWGIQTPQHWLAWQTGLSPTRARQLVDTARRVAELPATFAAFAAGELAVDQVAVVAKHTPAHNDAEACQLAKSATVAQLRHALGRYVHTDHTPAEPVPVEPGGGDPADRVSMSFDDHGRFALHLGAPADQGAVIQQALTEARDALFRAGNSEVTWLEAFLEICHRSLDTITSPTRRDRYRVYIHLGLDDQGGPATAWLNGGVSLPDALRDKMCCDATTRPLWHDGGLPVNVGRAHYIVPPHTRRLILDRDRTCRHPSCNCTTYLEVHHIIAWLKGGCTDMDDLVALCSRHHHAYHRGEFRMTGNPNIPGQLRFYDARGRPIPNSATPHPPTGPPPTPDKRYNHPTGERFDTWWLNLRPAPVPTA